MSDKNQKTNDVKFGIGAIVRHRLYPFRGVVVDVDPEFDNTANGESFCRCGRQGTTFYHLLAKTLKAITPPMSASRTLFLTVTMGQLNIQMSKRCLMVLRAIATCCAPDRTTKPIRVPVASDIRAYFLGKSLLEKAWSAGSRSSAQRKRA